MKRHTPTELLQTLLKMFSNENGELVFRYIEETSIRQILGKEVEDELKRFWKDL
jgi:hypothetical protein